MSFINQLANKLYKQSTSGWLGQKMNDIVGDDYQKHLLNMSLAGMTPLNAPAGYAMDYQQAEDEGQSGWNRVGQNAGRSAAILASIFGGSALGGGGASGGGSAAGGTAEGGSTGAGGGTAGGAMNWQKMLGNALGNMQQSQGGLNQATSYRSQSPDFSQPAFVQQPQVQQQGYYSPLAPNGMSSGLMSLGNYYG